MDQALSNEGLEWLQKSHSLFPDWSTAQRVRWAKAKEYVAHRFVFPIGEKGIDHDLPDFLRALPRPHELHVEHTARDYVLEVKRLIESKVR